MRSVSFRWLAIVVVALTLLAPGPARAGRTKVTFTTTFDDLTNDGGWTFGNRTFETIEPQGGNPGGYLRNSFLDAFAAQPRTLAGFPRTIFHGHYRERNVTFVGIDLAVFGADFSTQGRPLTVILVDDNGTPEDPGDDCWVYRIGGHPTPMIENEAWNRVITGVDQLRFFTGDPQLFYVFQIWDIGLDNPSITYEPSIVFP